MPIIGHQISRAMLDALGPPKHVTAFTRIEVEGMTVSIPPGIRSSDLSKFIDELQATRPSEIVLKNLAEDVDRTYWYSRHYVTLSQDTHSTVTAIEHHVLEEPGDRVIGCFGQRYDDYRDTVTLGIMVLFEAIRTLMIGS